MKKRKNKKSKNENKKCRKFKKKDKKWEKKKSRKKRKGAPPEPVFVSREIVTQPKKSDFEHPTKKKKMKENKSERK